MDQIEKMIGEGNYKEALDSIRSLRNRFPKAIDTRKRVMALWNEASLLEAQHEIAITDSALQVTLVQIEQAPTLLEQNMLRNKRDSLKARLDAESGVVRIIKKKQEDAQ